MDIIEVFASNMKKYRTLKGFSQEAFAEKAGLHRTYISAVERKKRSIALDNVQKIADALEIDTYLLFVDNSKIDDERRFNQ
jgi:transcriptional regulator with XRE-family HTH domain